MKQMRLPIVAPVKPRMVSTLGIMTPPTMVPNTTERVRTLNRSGGMYPPAAKVPSFCCCSNSSVFKACLQGRIIMGKPTATDITKPTRIISVTRLEGKCISTLPVVASVKLT